MARKTMVLTVAGLLLGSVAASGLAAAQVLDAPYPGQDVHGPRRAGQSYNPNEGLQPNGCVKLCPLDTNPCDPPEFKKADGRCTLKD